MTFYKKIGVSPTQYKIEQVRDDGLVRWVDADHAAFLKWKAEGNVPEKIEYVPPIVPPTEVEFISEVQSKNDAVIAFTGDALAAIAEIATTEKNEVDPRTLPKFVQSLDRVAGKKRISRDPEKMLSLLTAGIQQLNAKLGG
jgi:hypothetical protein